MTFYIYAPSWFSGFDSMLELITILTSFFIAFYAWKTFKYFNFEKYKWFSLTFFLIGISFIAKTISNLIFVVPTKRTIDFHFYTLIYTTYKEVTIIDDISFFIHKLTLLFALLILFFIISREKKIETIMLSTIFIITLAFLIESYLIFNFLVIMLGIYLFLINYFKDKQNTKKKEKFKLSKLTIFFAFLSLSYFFFFLAVLNSVFYFIAEIFLLTTFTYMLANLIMTFKK